MFHILDKTYLGYNDDLLFGTDCIQIVNDGSHEVAYDTEVGKLLSGTVSKRLKFAKTVDELLASFPSEDVFFGKLINYKSSNNRDELIIYCDTEAYKEFVVRWLKTVMPNADFETIKTVYNTYKNHEIYVTRHLDERAEDRTPTANYWCSSENELKKFFDKPAFNLTIDYKKYCSLEFQLATYAADNNSPTNKHVANKLHRLIQRRIVQDIQLIKSELEYNLYDLDLIWTELGDQDYDNLDVQEMIRLKPGLKFLGDVDFRHITSLKDLKAQYDIIELCKIAQDFIQWDGGRYGIADSNTRCLDDFIANSYEIPSVVDVLESELRYKEKDRTPIYLGPLIEKKKVNGHFFSYISELYMNKEKAQLQKLSLDKAE